MTDPGTTRKLSAEADFWRGLFDDLTSRIARLEAALAAVPTEDASAASLVRLKSYARALDELHGALDRVQRDRADLRLKPLFALDGPLAGFLSRLYGWCEGMGADFERMATALQRRQPTSVVFSHKAVNESYAQFDALIQAMRRANDAARPRDEREDEQRVWRAFEERVEELIWATEWVHMTLARPPGE